MGSRKYFCPNDFTEVDGEEDQCPECGYGPPRNWHERDWLDGTEVKTAEKAQDAVPDLPGVGPSASTARTPVNPQPETAKPDK